MNREEIYDAIECSYGGEMATTVDDYIFGLELQLLEMSKAVVEYEERYKGAMRHNFKPTLLQKAEQYIKDNT